MTEHVPELLAEFDSISDPKMAAINAKHGDAHVIVASAGWALTSERVVKRPEGIDEPALLDQIEHEMRDAPERLQWAMNQTLAEIGIANPELRDRAIDIGERLEVLKDYPTPPNCTSPFAPIWIAEIVRRNEAKA